MELKNNKYSVEWTEPAKKLLDKLDNSIQTQILKFLRKEAFLIAPEKVGKPLRYSLAGLYRFHISGFRVIAKIKKDSLVVLIVDIAKRDKIYN